MKRKFLCMFIISCLTCIFFGGTFAQAETNLVSNGDFESGSTNWENYTAGTGGTLDPNWEGTVATIVTENNGNKCLKFLSTSASNYVRQISSNITPSIVTSSPGQSYRVSFRFKWDKSHPTYNSANIQAPLMIIIYGAGDDTYNRLIFSGVPAEGVWTEYSVNITVPATTYFRGIRFAPWTTDMSIYYDDIKVVPLKSTINIYGNTLTSTAYTEANVTKYFKGSNNTLNNNAEIFYPVDKLSNGNVNIKYRHVSGRASSDSAILFGALYKTENGVKKLEQISTMMSETGTAEKPLSSLATNMVISMTDVSDDVKYSLEAFAWDTLNTLKPLAANAILNQ